MRVTIAPSKAHGRMDAPPSKSMAHRLLICAGLAEGTSVITNIDLSQDIEATVDCLRALGAELTFDKGSVTVRGTGRAGLCAEAGPVSVSGMAGRHGEGVSPVKAVGFEKIEGPDRLTVLPCRESGSTLRFMIPLCLLRGCENLLTGSRHLFTRPLAVYDGICRAQALTFEKGLQEVLVGGRLKAGEYVLPGNVSSQFISGLLFALPLLEEASLIRLIPPVESRPYIDMTLQALRQFGIRADRDPTGAPAGGTEPADEDYLIRIPGGQSYEPQACLRVEGDYSNAAFFQALDLLGGDVRINGLADDSLQGDRVGAGHLDRLNRGFAEIDLSDCPDLGPVLMAFAAARHGGRFTGTRRLRIKESDRGSAMKEELAKMGSRVEISDNEILVLPGIHVPGEALDGHNDHRIVMALSVLLTLTGGSIEGAEAVAKSLPDYFGRLAGLGIDVTLS